MKRTLPLVIAILLTSFVLGVGIPDEISVYVAPKVGGDRQANTDFNYTFNFSTSSACTNALLSQNDSVTTDADGIALITLNTTTLSTTPAYLCEYRDGVFQEAHYLNPNLFEENDTTYNEADPYLILNASNFFSFNETLLNTTIDARDADTTYTAEELYVYLDTLVFRFNETLLNATIDARDDDTQLTEEEVEDFVGGMFGGTETLITVTYQDGTDDVDFIVTSTLSSYTDDLGHTEDNSSWNRTFADTLYSTGAHTTDTDTHVAGDDIYLYNDSTTMYFNETLLNITIDARDADTTFTNGTGLNLTGTTFSILEVLYSNWNTAFGWGDHGVEGYLTSYTESDPLWATNLTLVGFLSENEAITGTWTMNSSTICTPKNGLCNQSSVSFTTLDSDYGVENVSSAWIFNTTANHEWSPTTADLTLGDADEGQLKLGGGYIGFADETFNGTAIDDIFVLWSTQDSAEDIAFMLVSPSNIPRFVITEEGADLATYNPRSMVIGPAATLGNVDENILCSTNFNQIDCNTSGSGADLGVSDDLEVKGTIYTPDWSNVTITESQISDLTHTTDTFNTTEQMQDAAGALDTGTETLISVTYDDAGNDIDYVVTSTLSSYTDDLSHTEDNSSWNRTFADTLYSTGAHTTDTNCNSSGSCAVGDVAYMDYANTGDLNISGNLTLNENASFTDGGPWFVGNNDSFIKWNTTVLTIKVT